jgi:hypothetical protein
LREIERELEKDLRAVVLNECRILEVETKKREVEENRVERSIILPKIGKSFAIFFGEALRVVRFAERT